MCCCLWPARSWLLQACATAAEQRRWLLISIHDMREFACQVLIRDIWRSDTVGPCV